MNVKGTMYVTRAAVKQFIAQGYGTIAAPVASVGGVNGNGSAAYTVSKGAEVALTSTSRCALPTASRRSAPTACVPARS